MMNWTPARDKEKYGVGEYAQWKGMSERREEVREKGVGRSTWYGPSRLAFELAFRLALEDG